MGVNNAGHEMVLTTDWISASQRWVIHLVDGRSAEVSDKDLRKWLRSVGESVDTKISYRKFAKYAMSHLPPLRS